MPWICLQFVIVVFSDHTHLLFLRVDTPYSFHLSKDWGSFCLSPVDISYSCSFSYTMPPLTICTASILANFYPHAFLKKRRGYCNRVRPLCYLLLNHWTKSNQIWFVSCSHEWGVQRHNFFCPAPGALGRGQKVKYH